MIGMTRKGLAGLSAFVLFGCSSEGGGLEEVPPEPTNPNARAGEIRGEDTWKTGTVLTGTVVVAPGAVVTIAPGAEVKCEPGVTVLVGGEIRARAAGTPARISCDGWGGITIAKGGKIDVEGLVLENADAAVATTEGALESTFAKGEIRRSMKPFLVGKGSSLVVDDVKVTTPVNAGAIEVSISEVRGKLVAKRLDYAAGNNQGLAARDGGELVVEDSDLHGDGGLDMVAAYDAKSVTIRYSLLRGAHCGPHIQGVEKLEIDHVTSESNAFGITLYKTAAGPHTIKDSNFVAGAWLDFQGDHGAIAMTNVFTSGGEIIKGGPVPTIQKAAARIDAAKPR